VDKGFMKKQFLQDQYGGAWFRGFGLMMKGVRKYGIRIMWVSLDCLEVSAISMFDFAS
jgi:hypothetical protein